METIINIYMSKTYDHLREKKNISLVYSVNILKENYNTTKLE